MKAIFGLLLAGVALSQTTDCGNGSVVNYQGVCVEPKYIQGCVKYATSSSCYQCAFNYVLLDGKCQYQQNQAKACCKVRDPSTGLCTVCEPGLFLENGKCVQKKVVGCLNQNAKGACTNCDKRFYLESGNCNLGVENCVEYTSFGDKKVCNKCKDGHSFINNACVRNKMLGCKTQQSGVCSECYDPFTLSNNHCEVANCKSHNDFGCTACECGYYLTQDRKCNEMTNGCIRYSRGNCVDCMHNFVLKGSICQIEGCKKMEGIRCVQCKDGYQSTDIGCQLMNCLVSKEGVCSACKDGYRLVDGTCTKEVLLQI